MTPPSDARPGGPELPASRDRILDAAAELFRELDSIHATFIDPEITSVRLVLNPEMVVIKESQRTFTYLHLFGYATDAVRTLVAYGFEHLDLHRAWASTLAHNTAARRVLEKCGFRREGVDREAVYIAGRRHDSLRYGLLRTEVTAP